MKSVIHYFRVNQTLPDCKSCHLPSIASRRDCIEKFGLKSREKISKDDDVICTTEYSRIVPLENGEVSSFDHFPNSSFISFKF